MCRNGTTVRQNRFLTKQTTPTFSAGRPRKLFEKEYERSLALWGELRPLALRRHSGAIAFALPGARIITQACPFPPVFHSAPMKSSPRSAPARWARSIARDTKLNYDVAIKVLPESVARDPDHLVVENLPAAFAA